MIAFGLALFFVGELAIARIELRGGVRAVVRGAAALSALGTAGVAFISYETSRILHFAVTFLAGPGGVVTVLTLSWVMHRARLGGRWMRGLSLLTALGAIVGLVVYVRQALLGGAESALLPVTQKVVALLVCLWISGTTRILDRSRHWGSSRSQNQ